ncbi:MFS transporter [Bradyrhizobium sp. 41S5]|uniref:MFS transporter n=1 Tax=Bradyrhizobium sp. 41S5 TaxID=1404443 RepID=UPI001AEF10E4|nr:MFS transporter [Bradyrhizobium sp. 41S5]UFX43927.1 MFS transporter [Bradyrhizobium sp. 41S5]
MKQKQCCGGSQLERAPAIDRALQEKARQSREERVEAQKIKEKGWIIVLMMFLFMLINFADKAVLGLSAESIMKELGLSHAEFGLIGTSFFAFFSIGAVLVGFVVNRISTKWVLLAMGLVWALCQLPMVASTGLAMLFANRVLLGAGEGPAYPVAVHAAYKWFPSPKRALPTSVIALGGAVGVGVVAPAVSYVISHYSWHIAFGALGLVGLVWCIGWLAVGAEGPLTSNEAYGNDDQARVGYGTLLTCRTFVGQAIVGFSAYWMLTLGIVWLPAYLEKGAGFSLWAVGWIVMVPSVVQIMFTPTVSFVSGRLRQRGLSARLSFGAIAVVCSAIAGVATVLLSRSSDPLMSIACTAIAFSVGSAIFVLGPVITAEIVPSRQRGAMLAIGTAVTTLAGPSAPIIMGRIIDASATAVDGFRFGFLIAGMIVIISALIGLALINPEADIRRFRKLAEASSSPAGVQGDGRVVGFAGGETRS